MINRVGAVLLAGLAALAACGDAREAGEPRAGAAGAGAAAGQTGDPATHQYAPELDVDLARMERTPTGLYVQDLAPGTGEPARPGDLVDVHYTGWLPNGREFDSSRGGEPFTFPIGQGRVIAGWDEGVAGMRPGGQRRLVIPSELAYGERGAGGVIPPHSPLVFDVELIAIQ